MDFTSAHQHDDGVLERRFTLDGIPGILWTPGRVPAPDTATPLILVGHPGGVDQMLPRLSARARLYAGVHGFAAATLELPGSGERPRIAAADQARAELRRAIEAGHPVDAIVDSLVLPLVEQAVPEWRSAIDALLSVPGIGGPVGYEGGVIAIGIRLAVVEPRIAAAVLFAGTFVPDLIQREARQVAVPVQYLLQWDDAAVDRRQALDLFDALGTTQKSLHANLGGHTGTPWFEVENAGRFFARHLA